MLATIKKFISNVFATTYEKPELQKELLATRTILTTLVIGSLDRIEELVSEKNIPAKNKALLQTLFKNMGLPTSNDISSSISVLNNFANYF